MKKQTQDADQQASPQGLRVLLVDDQDDLLAMMNLMLQRRRGFTIETARSGQQAIEKAPIFSPHVVISDIVMPGMDGYELMQNLRRLEGEHISPFKAIALTGYDSDHDRRVLTSGYDVHLTKPVDFDALLHTIDTIALDMQDKSLGCGPEKTTNSKRLKPPQPLQKNR